MNAVMILPLEWMDPFICYLPGDAERLYQPGNGGLA
jgi:hypothetical protein